MIGLSVAIARFVEALFWAILRVAGGITAIVALAALGLLILFLFTRRMLAKRR